MLPSLRRAPCASVAFLVSAALFASLAVLVPAGPCAAGSKFNRKVEAGQAAPDFGPCEGVDGTKKSLGDYAKSPLLLVVFTSNHCPVAEAYEDRIKQFAATYGPKGIKVVAVSCSLAPQDDLPSMKARAAERKFGFDYVFDGTQASGRAYGATVTPQVFLLDKERKIAYMGAVDDSMNPSKVRRHYLQDAADAVLAGKVPEVRETLQFGCRIEYAPQ